MIRLWALSIMVDELTFNPRTCERTLAVSRYPKSKVPDVVTNSMRRPTGMAKKTETVNGDLTPTAAAAAVMDQGSARVRG